MDYQSLIDKYYPLDNELKRILLVHSRSVAAMALRICEAHPELSLDKQFVEEAAMLHDIGIFRCNAPGIQCFGTEPYICHGQLGAEILRAEGFPRHARVCERHTGAGLSMTDIQSQHLPIIVPPTPSAEQDNTFWEPFLPETLEEKLICYADKFFSKTRLDNQKTVEQAEKSLAKFGDAGVRRFREWRHLFE
ncbi:MAG: HDIG domain-containing protein [Prevotella sp.]|nr:HDIG domain-containing protein [Prevotella sp.]